MEVSHFKIYNASAGSGKTYSLTKEYLKLLLVDTSPSKFRQILAITFTNKAVDEMKTRILDSLYAFGMEEPEKQGSLFHEICQDLSLSAAQLRERSKLVLKRILHNYSFFEISTIDKFNHKIIRTFARDFQLSQNFEVELDTELLLKEAVGRLLERSGAESELTQVLIAFSLEKIDGDKSWDIGYDLVEIGKLLFQENHTQHLDKLRAKTISEFKDIQKQLAERITAIENGVLEKAQAVLQEIFNQGFEATDFPRQTLPNHFKKITGKDFSTKTLYANKLEQNLMEGTILKSNDKRDTSHLATLVLEHFMVIKKELFQRNYLKNIYGNTVPLTLLSEIAKEIKNIELEKEVIPITYMNEVLSKEIRNQPAPFIYERLGEKYRHYFIDEFQDTSKVQWENLIPLIGNALESVNEKNELGSLFLVGDVKQAIYRWRGGRAEQFLDLINQKSHPFTVAPQIFSLDTNWRSASGIIKFNNSFFTAIAPFLRDPDYKDLFLQGCIQKPNTRLGGYVQLSFLDGEVQDKAEAYCSEVLKSVKEVLSKNYHYSDICVLVRKNDHGMLLANFLSENNIPIVSSESLLLKNNEKIIFLISLLRVIENQGDREAAYNVLQYLSQGQANMHGVISINLNQLEHFLAENYDFHIPELSGQSALTVLEKAIVQFDLATNSEAYLTFLMDELLVVEKREGSDIRSFLGHWEQKQASLSITAPNNINAVKIMTIHKAKGLEFPIVIFPFADSVIDDKRKRKKSWVAATKTEESLGLDEFLIDTKQEMEQYNAIAKEVYLEEVKKTQLDALNVLYVALTRAENGLYIISDSGKPIASLEQSTTYSDLFQYYLKENGVSKNEQGLYAVGSLAERNGDNEHLSEQHLNIPYISREKGDAGFAISIRSSRLWDDEKREAIELGNVIHYALSQIYILDDLPKVIVDLATLGHLEGYATNYITQKIKEVVTHPLLTEYFSESQRILNEQNILTVNGKTLRPDRIVIAGNEATIIDYKTGKPSPSHKEQITEYADVLKAMNFKIKHLIIVYIDQEINPVFL